MNTQRKRVRLTLGLGTNDASFAKKSRGRILQIFKQPPAQHGRLLTFYLVAKCFNTF